MGGECWLRINTQTLDPTILLTHTHTRAQVAKVFSINRPAAAATHPPVFFPLVITFYAAEFNNGFTFWNDPTGANYANHYHNHKMKSIELNPLRHQLKPELGNVVGNE